MKKPRLDRRVLAWASYDWANSAFATVVMAAFFPLLFQRYWSTAASGAEANLRLGLATGLGSLIIALIAPALGAVADAGGWKKRLLGGAALLGMLCTALLGFVQPGQWLHALLLYTLAAVGFTAANVLYDALLVSVAPRERWHSVSGLGYGVGYLGGGLVFAGTIWLWMQPARFGLQGTGEVVAAAFLLTALWWALFSLPLFLMVPEPPGLRRRGAVRQGLRDLLDTLRRVREHPMVLRFLLAYWLYIDAVGTVIRMAVAYGAALGLGSQHLLAALLVVQLVGFPAAIAFGRLGERLGSKTGLYIGLGVYGVVSVWGALLTQTWEFYALAVLIGLVQGGVQSLSRSLYARLIPPREAGQFYGFYNLLGKFAAILGPPLFGALGSWLGDVRYSMIALVVLFAAGALVLTGVHEQRDEPA